MKMKSLVTCTFVALFALTVPAAQAAVDQAGAKKLLNESGCLACHDETKTKVARSYKKIAAAYKGNSKAEAAITKHLTQPSQVSMGGEMMDHAQIETDDPAKVKNLVKWILSR